MQAEEDARWQGVEHQSGAPHARRESDSFLFHGGDGDEAASRRHVDDWQLHTCPHTKRKFYHSRAHGHSVWADDVKVVYKGEEAGRAA